MTSELLLLADARHADRPTVPTQRAFRPQMPSLRLPKSGTPITRPSLTPLAPQKDTTTMTPIHFGSQSQLIVAEVQHQEMVRNAMHRQMLREARVDQGSTLTAIRTNVANLLFSLAQAVKPAAECTSPASTPRPVA